MELVILIGLQASGKSTFARAHYAEYVYVSKDAMRNVRQKGLRQQAMIRHAFEEGENVIVDNTNPSAAVRAELIALGRVYGATITGYYFSSRLDECLARNRLREGWARVPDGALFIFRRQLERPTYAEGFDRLFFVQIDPGRRDFRVAPWNEKSGGTHDPA